MASALACAGGHGLQTGHSSYHPGAFRVPAFVGKNGLARPAGQLSMALASGVARSTDRRMGFATDC